MEKVYIGVDVGGMSIKAGAVNLNGEIIFKDSIVTDGSNVEHFLKSNKELLKKVIDECKKRNLEPLGIGFGVPGLIDNEKGLICKMANINGINVPLRDYLKDLNLPIKISNDANVACLAEQKYGAAKGYSDAIMITLGTGVGGGIVANNKLIEGFEGKGAELGHIVIMMNGESCGCGRKGCLEAYASASALLRQTKKAMLENKDSMMWEYCNNNIDNVSGLTSFECAKKGDEIANKVIDNYIMYLGEGLLNFCNIFRPQVFVIGGGISNQGDYLKNKLQTYLEKYNYGYLMAPKSVVEIAKLKNDAGIIGAASLFID